MGIIEEVVKNLVLVKIKEAPLPENYRGLATKILYLNGFYVEIVVDKNKCVANGGVLQYVATTLHELAHAAFMLLYPDLKVSDRYHEGVADYVAAYILYVNGLGWPRGLLLHTLEYADRPDSNHVAVCIKEMLGIDADNYTFITKRFESCVVDEAFKSLLK